jgi:predicted Zn-dependent peptidase
MKITNSKLKNGIKVIVVEVPDALVIASNVISKAGGRYEDPKIYGISHFLEHLVFKGTKSYPDAETLIKALEDLGGIVNAWTSEQATCYWNILPKDHFDTALKVLSEQVISPTLPPKEIEKERGPVLEEIKRSHDDPYSFVYRYIYDLMWPEQPIGNGVLGPDKNIKTLNRDDIQKYHEARYIAENMTICITGPLNADIVTEHLNKYFLDVPNGIATEPVPIIQNQTTPNLRVEYRDIKQGHLILGYKTFGRDDKRTYAAEVLMTILGRGMSSILFKEVRELRGLAYSVSGEFEFFSDAGASLIYAGLNKDKMSDTVQLLKDILKELKEKPLPEKRVAEAKEFIKGINLYRLDGVEKLAYWYTARAVLDPKNIEPDIFLENINKVTPEEVQAVANDIFKPENESLIILGPFKDESKFAKILAE